MLRNTFDRQVDFVCVLNPATRLLMPVDASDGQNLFKKSELVYVSPAEDSLKVHSYDYTITALKTIGAYDMLKNDRIVMATMSDMNVADKFENVNIS